jgi:hypothetical protein
MLFQRLLKRHVNPVIGIIVRQNIVEEDFHFSFRLVLVRIDEFPFDGPME